jgi:hypothetical protein
MAGGIDDILKEMERDDLEGATKLPPIQYAKLRGIYPQKVYTALRNNKLEWSRCECGRRVVVVEEADEYFKLGKWRPGTEQAVSEAEEA